MERVKRLTKRSFVPDLERPIPRRPLAKRRTTARVITFVRNWDSDVSDTANISTIQQENSTENSSLSAHQSILAKIASSPVPIVTAISNSQHQQASVSSGAEEDGEGDQDLSDEEKNHLKDDFMPKTSQNHKNQIMFDDADDRVPPSHASSLSACSPQLNVTKSRFGRKSYHNDDGQMDTDNVSVPSTRSRRGSGRSNRTIASTSTTNKTRDMLYASVGQAKSSTFSELVDNASQMATHGNDEQLDSDKESTSHKSSKHKSSKMRIESVEVSTVMDTAAQMASHGNDEELNSDEESTSGRAESSIISMSTKSTRKKSLMVPKKMNIAAENSSIKMRSLTKTGQFIGAAAESSPLRVNRQVSSGFKRQLSLSSTKLRKKPAHTKQDSDTLLEARESSQTPGESQTPSYLVTDIPANSDQTSQSLQPAKRTKASAHTVPPPDESDYDTVSTDGYTVWLWQGNERRNSSKILDLDVILNHFEETTWETRQQAKSSQIKKAINLFARGVQSELREMIAKAAKARKHTSNLKRSECILNKKRNKLLFLQQSISECKYNIAKMKFALKENKP